MSVAMPSDERPIACSLGAGELDKRRARWQALGEDALVEAVLTLDGARQTYRAEPAVERELRELVRLEAECCPFLDFDIARGEQGLVLRVSGPESAAGIVEVFGSGR
jgi:hypothetical protein